MNSPGSIRALGLAAALAAAALLTACNNSYGIMQSIQAESKVTGSSVFKTVAVADVLSDGTSYYARIAKIYTRLVAGSPWKLLTIGSAGIGIDYSATAMAGNGSQVFVATQNSNDKFTGVQVLTGSTWTAIDTSQIGNDTSVVVDGLWCAGSYVFAQAHKYIGTIPSIQDTYALYYSDGVAAFQQVALGSQTHHFAGVAFANSLYWYANDTRVLNTSAPTVAPTDVTGSPLGSVSIYDIKPNAGATQVYVGASNGYIYVSSGAASWSATPILVRTDFPITNVLEFKYGTTTALLAGMGTFTGATSPGYYEGLNAGSMVIGSAGQITHDESNYSITIADKPVNKLFWDAANTRLFACANDSGNTSGSGLYSNFFDGSSWTGWNSE
jgi:hypothetical protein